MATYPGTILQQDFGILLLLLLLCLCVCGIAYYRSMFISDILLFSCFIHCLEMERYHGLMEIYSWIRILHIYFIDRPQVAIKSRMCSGHVIFN